MSSDVSVASTASSHSEGPGPAPLPAHAQHPPYPPPHPPIGTVSNGKVYLGCKKEGCNGILCVASNAKHGQSYQCTRCLNKQKYCYDCQQLYINFRRHRKLGHELYEFQRKRQVRALPCLCPRAWLHGEERRRRSGWVVRWGCRQGDGCHGASLPRLTPCVLCAWVGEAFPCCGGQGRKAADGW